jgi:antitoxin (DNA-binding transcriptional repressor) of toxin-antitoxin stability system
MSETAVPVAEAAKDFLRLLDWVESRHESAILEREGRPVATLSPLPSTAVSCAELADRWPKLEKLSADEAFASAVAGASGRPARPKAPSPLPPSPRLRRTSRFAGAHRGLAGVLGVGVVVLLLAGCQSAPVRPEAAWRQTLERELPVLGHRNWIVIADSAYPAQTSPGVETIYTGSTQLETLKAVLAALDRSRHVRPIIHIDAELDYVPEALAPGVTAYRSGLKSLLGDRGVLALPHEQLIARLDEAGRTFRVLILKTDLTIPYTSVFLQLDCGYWGPEAEKQLRAAMGQGVKP